MALSQMPRFIDIGSNLGDSTFRGRIRGSQRHPDDIHAVLERAKASNVVAQILTGTSLKESKLTLDMCHKYRGQGLYTTAGCHPNSSSVVFKHAGGLDRYMEDLSTLIATNLGGQHGSGSIVAIGECGLDYDRLFLSDKESQLKVFPPQLHLASRFQLPLFLHCRTADAHKDFVSILKQHPGRLTGVVHSHTNSLEEALELIDMGFYIGINGCSLKTEDNLNCVKELPLSKLLLETDCPYCNIRPSHASHKLLSPLMNGTKFEHYRQAYMPPSLRLPKHEMSKMVKGRNEPCTIGQVGWCVSALKGVTIEEVAQKAYDNTVELFHLPVQTQDVQLAKERSHID